jgi:hypothetical protein
MMMKLSFLILIVALFGSIQGLADELQGTWKYDYFFYQGNIQPLPNPDLDLRFTFNADGTVLLKWFYQGQIGFCERKANYRIQPDGSLYQKVTWLNPNNHFSCSKDADMQMGKESVNNFQINKGQLYLEMALGDEPFFIILDFIPQVERTLK